SAYTGASSSLPCPGFTKDCSRGPADRRGPATRTRIWAAIVVGVARFRQPRPEGGDADDAIALVQAHHDHASRVGRIAIHRVQLGPHDLPLGRDEDELLVHLGDLLDGRHDAGLAALERDEPHALAASMLDPELVDRDALAIAGLGEHEQVRAGLHDAHRDDLVALLLEQADTDDAAGVAAHRPDLALVELGEHALGGGEDHVVLTRRHVDPGELVVLVERDRADSGRADALELLERRLLDDP